MKLAVVCEGKAQLNNEAPLKFIGASVDRVSETLSANGWECVPYRNAKSIKDFKNLLIDYVDTNIDDFLFYYIGHGYGNNIDTFQIYFDEHPLTIEQVMKDLIKGALKRYPKNIALVLDACYSGQAIDSASLVKDAEILTARGRDEEAFEKIMPDNQGWSEFSFYFCNIFKTLQETNTLSLEQIGKYIADEKQTGKDTFYLPNPSSSVDQIIIGYNKEVHEIRNALHTEYDDLKQLKYDVLSYIPKGYNGLREINEIENIKDLINYLIRKANVGENYLYCLLEHLNICDNYRKFFSGNTKCIKETPRIDEVIAIFNYDCSLEKYDISFYYKYDIQDPKNPYMLDLKSYSIPKSQWDKFVKNTFTQELNNVLQDKEDTKPYLILILPPHRFEEEFHQLEIFNGLREGKKRYMKLREKFNIYIKLHYRLINNQQGSIDKYIYFWKKSCKQIQGNYSNIIVEYIKNPNTDHDLIQLKNDVLSSEENIEKLIDVGIPIMLTTLNNQESFNKELIDKWKSKRTTFKSFKEHTFEILRQQNNQDYYFLYDGKYSQEFLDIYNGNIGKSSIDENNFLGGNNG